MNTTTQRIRTDGGESAVSGTIALHQSFLQTACRIPGTFMITHSRLPRYNARGSRHHDEKREFHKTSLLPILEIVN